MIKRLLAIRLRGTFMAAMSGKDKNGNPKAVSKGKILLFSLIYTVLGLCVLYLSFFFSVSIAGVLVAGGAEAVYYGIFMIISFSVVFLLSIFETKAELFDCKDNELLLSMPIKPRDILISRIFTVLVYNYIIEALLMIPVIISSLIFGGSIVGAVGAVFVFLTLPLLATALSAGVGYLVHLGSIKFERYKNIAIIAISLAFLAAYFIGYNLLINNLESILSNLESSYEEANGGISVIAVIGSVTSFSPISFITYVIICALVSYFALYIITKNYMKLLTASKSAKKVEYVEKKLVKKSVFTALVKKEFSRFTSSPTYMLNGGLGLVFELVVAVLIALKGASILQIDPAILAELGLTSEALAEAIGLLFIAVLMFCESMNLISSSALSLEGKSLWIIKSMPVKPSVILMAKSMPNAVLNFVVSAVSGFVIAISLGSPVTYYPIYVFVPAIGGIMFAFAGIIINVLIPKFEFVNEAQVVKQSAATLVSMLVNFLLSSIVMAAATITLAVGFGLLISYMTLLVLMLLTLAMYLLISGPIAKKYSTL